MNEKLLQKKGRIVAQIAAELLGKKVDDRFMSIMYYQEKYGASQGTIQNAINFLKEKDAIQLKNKGYQGSYIKAINYDILLDYCKKQEVRGSMPLPRTSHLEVLAYYIHQRLQDKGIEYRIDYMQNEAMELDGILQGTHDFMICSKFMAQRYIKKHHELSIAMEFHLESYLRNPVLVRHHEPKKELYVVNDTSSLRMLGLHYAEMKGLSVRLLPQREILHLLKQGEDMQCILSKEDFMEDTNFYVVPLDHEEYKDDTVSVILIRKDHQETEDVLKLHLQPDELMRIYVQYEEHELELQY